MDVSSVPVVGTLADLFPRTSAPSLFIWSSSRSAHGVGAARIGHSHCESEGGGYSWVLYWFRHTSLQVQEVFDLMLSDKSTIYLRVPHLLSSIMLILSWTSTLCCSSEHALGSGWPTRFITLTDNQWLWRRRKLKYKQCWWRGKHSSQCHCFWDDMSQG